ncbi:SDR family NAD(P)-dependent oxidoreductase [Pseudomonas sp. NFX224]|uniref:SDR family NAD(P)-dependent oxidoreductase n=1 Tax=Pseudomonas sp. NFX224 TaxID=3402862 RepID=UPI003AFB3892
MTIFDEFKGRTVLICGSGGGGIGTATTFALAQAGANIVGVDFKQDLLDESKALVEGLGRQFHGILADLCDPLAVARIVPTAIELTEGPIHYLANIAGGMQAKQWGPFEGIPDNVFRDVMALNFDYVFTLCRDVSLHMKEHGEGGAIVNVSSISALPSAPLHASYGAAKAAVISMTRSMAVELGRYGIRANVIAPGATKTARAELISKGAIDERQREWAPLKRPTASADVANAIRFFLSTQAAGITGQLLAVDCGLTARSALGGIEYLEPRASW